MEEGLWQDVVDPNTGRHSLNENIQPKVIAKSCGDHYFVEEGNTRFIYCTKCGFGGKYILGVHRLEDGKLVKI